MTDTPRQFPIPLDCWADFAKKMAKLNKRAAKLGCPPITWDVLGEDMVERSHTYKTEDGEYTRTYRVKARIIVLHGTAPRLQGWDFVARIEYLSDLKSMLFHTVPGADVKIDERFRTLTAATCEHCAKRRIRRDTFVVRNVETGQQTQVGRQCLADFTGINSPERIASTTSWLATCEGLDQEFTGYFGVHFGQRLDTLHVLSLTSAYIAECGWIPRSAASEVRTSTATLVGEHFLLTVNSPRAQSRKQMSALAETPEHLDRARRVVEWIKRDLSTRARSDYEMNLVTLVTGDLCEQRHLGIVCSAVAAYQRAMNQQVEYARKREALRNSQPVGEVGKRLRGMPVKVEFVKALEPGQFGPRTLIKFSDQAGNVMTWFASGDQDYTPGTRCTIDGTVKGHSEYNGVRETQLSRVAVRFPAEAEG